MEYDRVWIVLRKSVTVYLACTLPSFDSLGRSSRLVCQQKSWYCSWYCRFAESLREFCSFRLNLDWRWSIVHDPVVQYVAITQSGGDVPLLYGDISDLDPKYLRREGMPRPEWVIGRMRKWELRFRTNRGSPLSSACRPTQRCAVVCCH